MNNASGIERPANFVPDDTILPFSNQFTNTSQYNRGHITDASHRLRSNQAVFPTGTNIKTQSVSKDYYQTFYFSNIFPEQPGNPTPSTDPCTIFNSYLRTELVGVYNSEFIIM